MGDEIDPSVLQATQQKLGKFIQKPQLTDKLLKRPPFRFVHDIVTASIKQYGIFDNVFTKQELVSDNIKEKEEKIAFLQKLINHVSNELGQELNVKPSKIVAGSEAEKTNELLQALASVLENKHSKKNPSNKKSSESIANSKGIEQSNTPTKVKKTSNGTNKPAASKADPAPAITKKTESTKESTIVKKPTTKPVAKPAAPTKTSNVSSKPSIKPVAKAEALIPESDTPKRNKSDAEISMLNHDQTAEISINKRESITSANKLSASSKKKSARDKSPVPFPGPELYSTSENEPVKDIEAALQFGMNSSSKQSPQMSPDLASTDSGITVEHPPSAPLNGIRSMKPSSARAPALDEGFDAADGIVAEEADDSIDIGKLSPPRSAVKNTFEKTIAVRNNVDTSRPSSGNKGIQRPRSSRRPPSRTLRDRLSVIRQDSRPMSGQVPRVIIEGNTYSDDEEDRIVQAAVFDQTIDDLTQSGADQLLGGEQGKLVEEILSAQRQLDPVAEESGIRDTTASSAQVQHLKTLIQEMAQSALPLGQLIPLIHEDIESMQQEWQLWKKEADTLEEQYNQEKTALDGYLVKLETELQELDRTIQEEQMKLNAEKASVFRSEKDVSLVISNFSKKR